MTKAEAREWAETKVYVYMNRGDIEAACRVRGIKVIRNRLKMEESLITEMVNELTTVE